MKANKILTYSFWILCLLCAACSEIYVVDNQSAPASITFKQDDLTIRTAKAAHHFAIEIAEKPDQQELGLMHRTNLPRDHGMLFIMSGDIPVQMWMKDTLIPLDMVFIDQQGKIVYIAANTVPESTAIVTAGRPVRAVLELAGGTAAMDGIQVGDRVIHSYFKP